MSEGYQLLEQGERLLAENRIEEAIERFRRFLDDYPDDIEGQYQLGIALYEKGELEEATAAFRAGEDAQRPAIRVRTTAWPW